jgi:phosphatidylserine/phosphatidylglycerophosphate/cardiolipin synthase-like enzyme
MADTDWFLSSASTSDDWEFRADSRTSINVIPFVDGVETFAAIERAIASAKKTVNLSAWIFNSHMPLQAKTSVNKTLAARKAKSKVSNWGELLAVIAALGVEVRVLLTDFDPVFKNDHHESNWMHYQKLLAFGATFGAGTHLQAMVSMHDARPNVIADFLVHGKAAAQLTSIVTKLNSKGFVSAQARLLNMPRLWSLVKVNKPAKKIDAVSSPSFNVCPVAHHQKICIVDSTVGFCGGLDQQTSRIDTREHKGGWPWHDTECSVDGAVALDLDRNFAGRWNHEMGDFNTFVGGATFGSVSLAPKKVTAMTVPTTVTPGTGGTARAQLIRTLSKNAWVGNVPANVRKDIEEAYKQAIGLAQSFIYIENQYVRSTDLGDWIVARANSVPQLQVIIVLPVAPEEVTSKSGADPITNQGLFLQHKVLTDLKTKLGTRFGMYSMVVSKSAKTPAPGAVTTNSAGSPQIYVHSKTMIVDDVWATIGSANTNPRSFEVDTEANIHWYDPVGVKKLRLRLWGELLGSPAGMAGWAASAYVAKWEAIAKGNLPPKAPGARQGFIVPHDPNRFLGVDDIKIPDEFAELVDVPAEPDPLADTMVA